ncbi:inner membrane symporter YicJ [Oxobacter pfennigii]|uniref:Inner membrane symporter YicJ n=1 Tax=Oxobacter pfennigii TaxID=36849 RepID=A0A0P8Y843_9CLOT|nr:glycoside-pentoside-hexuronide (GPH):cation symporter [Oxobacter pfennigii]KPU42813.1 inner membrane symporter YicJ [Oxobacter pfennigii]
MSSVTNINAEVQFEEVSNKEVGAYGLGYFGYNLGSAGLMTYLTFFYTDYMKIPAASVAMILLVSRFLDGATDLFLGVLIDRTTSKYGKARPWLLWMALPAAISVSLLYYVPNISTSGKVVYAFITYNAVAFFYLTCMALPMQALVALITPDPKRRLTISTVGSIFNTLAAVVINLYAKPIMAALGGEAKGMFWFFTIMAFAGVGLMLLCFAFTKERAERRQYAKVPLGVGVKALFANKYWWNITLIQIMTSLVPSAWGATVYYTNYITGNAGLVGPIMSLMWGGITIGIFMFIPVTRKLGKRNAGLIGMALQVLGSVVLWFAPASVGMLWFSTVLRSIGPAAMIAASNAMRADTVEYGEWKTGVRNEGMIYSGASFGGKVGSGIGGAILAALLASGGYVGGAATQTPEAIEAIKAAFIILPGVGSTLIMVMLAFFDLEKFIPQINKDLKERRAKAAV